MIKIDTENKQFVASRGDHVLVMWPKRQMTPDEALIHAAWLVALAEPTASSSFADVLEAVRNT